MAVLIEQFAGQPDPRATGIARACKRVFCGKPLGLTIAEKCAARL